VRQVRHVRFTEEGQQMMLAQRVDLDVAHADQIFVALVVQGVPDDVGDGHVVAAREPLERRFHAGGRLAQALPGGVLAELREHVAHQRLEHRPPFGGRQRLERLGVLLVEAVQASGLHFVASHACWASGAGLSSAHVKLKLLAFVSTAGATALSALWTFPSILAAAFLVAWGAEAAQFLISQGLALAILAWLQTLPEFAVEAVIAWDAGRDPERAHLAIANLSGAPAASRWAYRQRGWRRQAAIGGLFATGGGLLYATAHPFLESMLAVAGLFGVSQFVLVQWVAPFLSEFPEKVSAFYWARR